MVLSGSSVQAGKENVSKHRKTKKIIDFLFTILPQYKTFYFLFLHANNLQVKRNSKQKVGFRYIGLPNLIRVMSEKSEKYITDKGIFKHSIEFIKIEINRGVGVIKTDYA